MARVSDRLYFLVFEAGTSQLFHLPRNGAVMIGRGDEVDLALTDEAVSRRHARIVLADGEVRLTDLDSHNGTRVNGEKVESVVLRSGDVVSICGATLVLHSGAHRTSRRMFVELEAFSSRLEEEV